MSIRKGNTIIAGGNHLEDYAKDSEVVHKDGDEIITGVKTFTGSGSTAIQIKNTNSTADVVPTENNGRFLEFVDKDGIKEGYLEFYHHTGKRYIAINANKDAGVNVAGQIAVGIDNQNKVFTHAPTPETSSNGNDIATTQWVKSVAGVGVVAYQHPTAANGYTWYRKYADGWVEQGSQFSISAGSGPTYVTFPIEMKDTNYQVLYMAGTTSVQWATNQVVNPQCLQNTRSTTSCGFVDNLYNNTKAMWQVSGIAK